MPVTIVSTIAAHITTQAVVSHTDGHRAAAG